MHILIKLGHLFERVYFVGRGAERGHNTDVYFGKISCRINIQLKFKLHNFTYFKNSYQGRYFVIVAERPSSCSV
jgi:hypothetical protein